MRWQGVSTEGCLSAPCLPKPLSIRSSRLPPPSQHCCRPCCFAPRPFSNAHRNLPHQRRCDDRLNPPRSSRSRRSFGSQPPPACLGRSASSPAAARLRSPQDCASSCVASNGPPLRPKPTSGVDHFNGGRPMAPPASSIRSAAARIVSFGIRASPSPRQSVSPTIRARAHGDGRAGRRSRQTRSRAAVAGRAGAGSPREACGRRTGLAEL